MKIKITKHDIKSNNEHILSVGYCDMQYLLNYQISFAYSTRAEGWACDYYDVDGVIISTGYSPLHSQNMREDYNLISEYESKAATVDYSSGSYEERAEKVNQLLYELLEKLKK